MSTADDTRLPGLDQTAALRVWDRVQQAADRAHDSLLSDAELAGFDRDAITREAEFAAAGWALERTAPAEEPDAVTSDPVKWCEMRSPATRGSDGRPLSPEGVCTKAAWHEGPHSFVAVAGFGAAFTPKRIEEPGDLYVDGVRVTGPSVAMPRLAEGTIAPLDRDTIKASEQNAGRSIWVRRPEDGGFAMTDADDAEALGRWLLGWAERRRGR